MLPDREGRFKAAVLEHGVAETGQNNLATFTAKFSITDELLNGEWVPVDAPDSAMEITGYFYLEKKDGSLNTITIDQLKSAFGWDGADLMWLQDTDLQNQRVQLKLEFDTWNGQQKIKVRWIDAENAEGRGVPKATDEMRRNLTTRLGARLRAENGGTPVAPPKTQGKPTAPPARPSTPAASAPPTAPAAKTATMQQAWDAFCKGCPKSWKEEEIQAEWFQVIGRLFPGKEALSLTPADWHTMLVKGPAEIIPM